MGNVKYELGIAKLKVTCFKVSPCKHSYRGVFRSWGRRLYVWKPLIYALKMKRTCPVPMYMYT